MAEHVLRITSATIGRNEEAGERSSDVVVARWRLLDVLKSHTLVGVFDDAQTAALAVGALEASGDASRVWKARGRAMGNDVRHEWRQRSFWRRVLGFSDESRVVESLARHLEAGSCLVAVRMRNEATPNELLPGASHLIRVGVWSFAFLR